MLTLSQLSWWAEKGSKGLLTSLGFGCKSSVSAQRGHREAQVAQQILGLGQGGEDRAGFSLPQALKCWGCVLMPSQPWFPACSLSPLMSLQAHLATRSNSVLLKRKENQFASMHNCLLSLLKPHTPTNVVMHTYSAGEKGYYISRLFPHYFYCSAHYRKGSGSISRKMFLFPHHGFQSQDCQLNYPINPPL